MALVATGLGLLVLRLGRGWSLTGQLRVVVLALVASMVGGTVLVARAMFLSTHDLAVTLWVAGVSGLVALLAASLLGRSFMRAAHRLLASARAVGSGATVTVEASRTSELDALARELAATSERLAQARARGPARRGVAPGAGRLGLARPPDAAGERPRHGRGARGRARRRPRPLPPRHPHPGRPPRRPGGRPLRAVAAPGRTAAAAARAHLGVRPGQRRRRRRGAARRGARGRRSSCAATWTETLVVDHRQLARALENLLSNALRYSPPGAEVEISVLDRTRVLEIAVTDQRQRDRSRRPGPGLRGGVAGRRRAVRRADRAAGDPGGAGLGLAIVRSIVEAHAGTVAAHERRGRQPLRPRASREPPRLGRGPGRRKQAGKHFRATRRPSGRCDGGMSLLTDLIGAVGARQASSLQDRLATPARTVRVTVVLGRLLAARLLRLLPHRPVQPLPAEPAALDDASRPGRPNLYRITQGLHVATGTACIPLLLAKLWTVYPRLFSFPPFRTVLELAERLSIAVLVSSSVLQLVMGLLNTYQWYPWRHFAFRDVHYALSWVVIGSIALHVAVQLPKIIRWWRRGSDRLDDGEADR